MYASQWDELYESFLEMRPEPSDALLNVDYSNL
jgi:hypothetical protein